MEIWHRSSLPLPLDILKFLPDSALKLVIRVTFCRQNKTVLVYHFTQWQLIEKG